MTIVNVDDMPKQLAPPRFVTAPIEPEFIRLPKPGETCPHTGLTRSFLNALILPTELNNRKPPVRSVSLRKKGSVRGVRLIVYASLMQFLCARAEAQ